MTKEEFIKNYLKYQAVASGMIRKSTLLNALKEEANETITNEELNKLDADMYLDGEFLISNKLKEKKSSLKKLKLKKEETEDRKVSFENLKKYYSLWLLTLEDFEKITNRSVEEDLINFICLSDLSDSDLAMVLKENYEISKSKQEQLDYEITLATHCIRKWHLNGFSNHELVFPRLIDKSHLSKTPKETDLASLLKESSMPHKEALKKYYQEKNFEKLKEKIVEEFHKDLQSFWDEKVEYIISLNHHELTYHQDYDMNFMMSKGYLYNYSKNIAVVPDEILKILENTAKESEYKEVKEYVYRYMVLNGTLKKETLQEYLRKDFNQLYSIQELDKIILDLNDPLIRGGYYTYIKNYSQEQLCEFVKEKEKIKIYKKAEDYNEDAMDILEKELSEIVSKKIYGQVLDAIKCLILFDSYDEVWLSKFLKDVNLADKKIEEVQNVIKKYKEDVPTWIYNGFTKKEAEEKVISLPSKPFLQTYNNTPAKSEKVGRNEPCPCGSGKKYKKCCGK